MVEVQGFRCEICGQISGDPATAAVHETACKKNAEAAATQAGIRLVRDSLNESLAALKQRCKHPNMRRDRISGMPGDNYSANCPDCDYSSVNYDQSR